MAPVTTPAPALQPPTPPRRKRERWWWLALTLVVSLLLHVGIGWESRGWRLLGPTGPVAATPSPGEVEVDFSALPNKPGVTPVQTASRPIAPHTAAPTQPEKPIREAPHRPSKSNDSHSAPAQLPPTRSAPTAAANNNGGRVGSRGEPVATAPAIEHPASPLPPTQTAERPQTPVAAPSSTPATPVAPTPVTPTPVVPVSDPPTAPATRPVLPTKPVTPDKPAPDKPATEPPTRNAPPPTPPPVPPPTPPPVKTPTPPPTPPVTPPSTRIGISRGIPFGGRTGLSDRFPPGEGIGPDGQPTGVRSGYDSNGVFHVHIAKPTAASLGLTPARIVYVLDVSGSMTEDNKIGLARAALRDAVNELLPDDEFTFITFSNHVTTHSKTLRPATPFDISTMEANVDLVEPNGNTDLSDALDKALGMTGVHNIFLISDGLPNLGISDPDVLIAHLKDVNPNAAVHITVFALGPAEQFEGVQFLHRIADENAGEYRYINDTDRADK